MSTERVVAVDLPHYHHHHLQSCWRKNLGLEAVNWKTAKVVVAPRCPPCQDMRNVSSRRRPNSLRFLVIDSETVHEPVSYATAHDIAF